MRSAGVTGSRAARTAGCNPPTVPLTSRPHETLPQAAAAHPEVKAT